MAGKNARSNSKNLLIGLGFFLLILAGFFYFSKKISKQPAPSPTISPQEIIVQQEGLVQKTGENVQPLTEEQIKKTQDEINSVLSSGGQKAILKDVSDGRAGGEARRAFSDGKFYFKITLSNLNLLEKGYYYEGFLEKDKVLTSVGRVEVSNLGNGTLYYTSSQDKSDYPTVLIGLEQEGAVGLQTKILEGSF